MLACCTSTATTITSVVYNYYLWKLLVFLFNLYSYLCLLYVSPFTNLCSCLKPGKAGDHPLGLMIHIGSRRVMHIKNHNMTFCVRWLYINWSNKYLFWIKDRFSLLQILRNVASAELERVIKIWVLLKTKKTTTTNTNTRRIAKHDSLINHNKMCTG